MVPKIELLSPAKDLNCAMAAIESGADAVYLGWEKFNARHKAGNSLQDIQHIINIAHQFKVKVYLVLNIILFDEELVEAKNVIQQLYDCGLDGIIIQDYGLLKIIPNDLPIVASTQMHNDTLAKIKFLKNAGFHRVILPRENSLTQIKEIHQAVPDIELEVFIHGALCVCYSGQCYLSYAQGGRSANRGECAQPCREEYSLRINGKIIGNNKHLLSLKDLCLLDELEELIAAGVTSFKIEGRLKDEDYVRNVTAACHQKLDKLIASGKISKSSSGKVFYQFNPDVNKSFNRGFTDYFIKNRKNKVSSMLTPKALGEYIGVITKVHHNYFELENNILANADGICFFKDDKLIGKHINRVEGNKVYPQDMKDIYVGSKIYRNLNHKFKIQLTQGSVRKIIVQMTLEENDKIINLRAVDEDGNEVAASIENTYSPVENIAKFKETATKQLSSTGNTIFLCENVILQNTKSFIPIKILNSLRREALDFLLKKRIDNYQLLRIKRSESVPQYPLKQLTYTSNVLNKNAEEYLTKAGVESIEPAAESGLNLKGKKVMVTKYCLANELGKCGKISGEKWELINSKGNILALNFNCKECLCEICFS